MKNNIWYKAVHISSDENSIADSISHQQWQRFKELAPDALQNPAPVPAEFHSMILELNQENY